MILRDVNGGYIYPAQIHDILVTPSIHTPKVYDNPGYPFALVVEGKEWDGEESAYFAPRYVIGWFTTEERADTARHNLIASFGPKYQEEPNDVVFAVAWQEQGQEGRE